MKLILTNYVAHIWRVSNNMPQTRSDQIHECPCHFISSMACWSLAKPDFINESELITSSGICQPYGFNHRTFPLISWEISLNEVHQMLCMCNSNGFIPWLHIHNYKWFSIFGNGKMCRGTHNNRLSCEQSFWKFEKSIPSNSHTNQTFQWLSQKIFALTAP